MFDLLPSPIAYCRHLVDTEDNPREKIDQFRVLVQNTYQLLAGILISDCQTKGFTKRIPRLPTRKKLAIGDLVTLVNQASIALIAVVDECFVPQLVELYGLNSREARERRQRGQYFVEIRNQDVHAASLAQTSIWLEELTPIVEQFLKELEFLQRYLLVSVTSLDVSPDKKSVTVHGRRCHGPTQKYTTVVFEGTEILSHGEVVLTRHEDPTCLSLRPWFLFSAGSGYTNQGTEELLVLSEISRQGPRYIGLITGESYRFDSEGWLADTFFGHEDHDAVAAFPLTCVNYGDEGSSDIDSKYDEDIADDESHSKQDSNIDYEEILGELLKQDSMAARDRREVGTWIVLETPLRDVPVGLLRDDGVFWLQISSLRRANRDGLLGQFDLDAGLSVLPFEIKPSDQQIELSVMIMREIGIAWIAGLANSI